MKTTRKVQRGGFHATAETPEWFKQLVALVINGKGNHVNKQFASVFLTKPVFPVL